MSRSFKGSYRSLPTKGKAKPVTVKYADGSSEVVGAGRFQKFGSRAQYRQYRRSVKWARLRKSVLERDNHRCVICKKTRGQGVKLEVHHKTYDRLYNERVEDLVTLCQRCHATEHQWAQRRGEPLTVEGRKM